MRLAPEQISIIKQSGRDIFGPKSKIWVFGSRVDDSRKGGDIDLMIEPELDMSDSLFNSKIKFLAQLELLMGQQKIDLVIGLPGDTRPIVKIAKEQGALL